MGREGMLRSTLPPTCTVVLAILSFLAASSAFEHAATHRRRHGSGGDHGLPHRSMTRKPSRDRAAGNLFSTSSDRGALSASGSAPRLNPALIESALTILPWEIDNDSGSGGGSESAAEEIGTGQRWLESRQILTKLWVLPRDMSNGAAEHYARAANDGEDRMLAGVPQLLRLAPGDIEASAKTVLSLLGLPPALLRREPLLLTVPSADIVRGFDRLHLAETGEKYFEGSAEKICEGVRELCRDTPGLLLGAATDESE